MQITDLQRNNFDFKEFFNSNTLKDNQLEFYKLPQDTQEQYIENGMLLADKMQELRDKLGFAIDISSAWRSSLLNKMVGGKQKSQHLIFQACDWRPIIDEVKIRDASKLKDIVLKIKELGIVADQCLIEESWIHYSIKKTGNRNQFATYFKNSVGKRVLKII